jgi:hypothetical protein
MKPEGLYQKYRVTRTDGQSEPGCKHHECKYFVLDMKHDKHAKAAILAYAHSCEGEYPALAFDLLVAIGQIPPHGLFDKFPNQESYSIAEVQKWLGDLGADGLLNWENAECACLVNGLFPCDGPDEYCVPGWKGKTRPHDDGYTLYRSKEAAEASLAGGEE